MKSGRGGMKPPVGSHGRLPPPRRLRSSANSRPPTMLHRMLDCVSGLANSPQLLLSHSRCHRRHLHFVGVHKGHDFFPPLMGGAKHFVASFPRRAPALGEGSSHVLQGLLDLIPRASLLSYKVFSPFQISRSGLLLGFLFGSRFDLQASLLGSRHPWRLGPALLQWNNTMNHCLSAASKSRGWEGGGGCGPLEKTWVWRPVSVLRTSHTAARYSDSRQECRSDTSKAPPPQPPVQVV